MKINWFPGHMKKALDLVQNDLKLVNCIIYLLDARAPLSCLNPSIEKIIQNKPILYVLSKSDLADEKENTKWKNYFSKNNSNCIALDSRLGSAVKSIPKILIKMCQIKIDQNSARGIKTTIRAMVVGVPNTGKSTLINSLCGKSKAITGDRPGVTRAKQWVRIHDSLELMDTPGTLWPNLDNNRVAHNLCYIGSIKDEVVDTNDLAFDFINDMMKKNKNILENRYNIKINDDKDTLKIINDICQSHGFLLKNNDYDYDRCFKAIIDDFRKGRMGKISLETL